MTGNHDLLARLRSTKPDQPEWWMVERDDRETRPLYLISPGGAGGWTADWREGFRFPEQEHAQQQVELWHPDYGHARSHGMMAEYYNPDGTEAAETIEELMEALRDLEGANEEIAAQRSARTYHSIVQDGAEALLLCLDNARSNARTILAKIGGDT